MIKKRIDIIDEIKQLEKKQNENRIILRNLEKELSKIEGFIEKKNNIIGNFSGELQELEYELKELQRIDEHSLNKEIEELYISNQELYFTIGSLKEELGGKIAKKDIYLKILKEIKQSGMKEVLCLICQKGRITRSRTEEKLNIIEREVRPIQKKLNAIDKQIAENNEEIFKRQSTKREKHMIPLIKKKIDDIYKPLFELQLKKDKFGDIKAKIPVIKGNIELIGIKIQKRKLELRNIEEEIKKR